MRWFNREKRNNEDIPIGSPEDVVSGAINLLKAYANDNYGVNISAVWRAVTLISDAVAELPMYLYKEDSKGQIHLWDSHPVSALLRKPNAWQTSHVWRKVITKDILLHGNAYSIIERDSQAKVTAIKYVPHSKMTVQITYDRQDAITPTIHYIVSGGKAYEADEVLHFRGYLAEDGIMGEGVLTHAAKSLELATSAEKQAETFFTSACLNGVLTKDTNLSQKQIEEIRKSWLAAFSPAGSGIAIVHGGVKYQQIGLNATDAQLLESRKYSVEEIGRWFSVSPILLYSSSAKQTYNSAQAAHENLYSDTLQPLLDKIQAEMEDKLFLPSEKSRANIEFDLDTFLKANAKERAEFYTKMLALGALSPNEIRAAEQLEPLEEEGADEHFLPVNICTVSNAKNLALNTTSQEVHQPGKFEELNPTEEQPKDDAPKDDEDENDEE